MPDDVIPIARPLLNEDCVRSVAEQVATSFVGPGATAAQFGTELAVTNGVLDCVPVASGTVALSVAAIALGLQPGDEVVVPAYGVISVINAFASIGLRPILVDVGLSSGCIDPGHLEQVLTKSTKAVCFVDFAGSIGSALAETASLCHSRGVPLIEDAAWALGRVNGNLRGGAVGDIGATSFSVAKIITTGQGGAVFTKTAQHRDAVVRAVDQGGVDWRQTQVHDAVGSNLRLSDLAASLGLPQLRELPERRRRQSQTFATLLDILGDRLFQTDDRLAPTQHIVFSDDRDGLIKFLRSRGIVAQSPYQAMHQHRMFAHLSSDALRNSEAWAERAVYLPFGPGLTEADATRVGAVVDQAPMMCGAAPSGEQ